MLVVSSLYAGRKKRANVAGASGPKKTVIRQVKSDAQSMKERDKAIKQLKDLLHDYPEGPRKAGVYRRLAELYWDKARAIKDVVMSDYNKATDKYYELNDPSAPMPELDLKPAWVWNKKAVDVCDYIIKKYPDFSEIDEVYFFMASNLMEIGQPLKAIRYFKLVVEKFPNSKYAADAYFSMGEYFFNNNNVFKAIPNYKAIIDRYKTNKFYDFALYKYAWCMYNVGEYKKSVKLFQQVVEHASAKKEKIDLKEDALKDMVAPYAEAGTVDDAERYFKTIVKDKKYYIMVLRKLAQIYFEQDRSKEAIVIYGKLLKEAPLSPSAPLWQKQIVEAYKKLNNKEMVRKSILQLVKNYADMNTPWSKANKKDESTIESARQAAETALRLLTVDYHNEARKTNSKETWRIVGELYPTYLKYFPKSEAAYDMRFNYAEFLYDHKLYKSAGEQYQIVADMNPKGQHFEDASFGAVSCFGALLEKEQKQAKEAAKQRIIAAKKAGAGTIQRENITVGGKKQGKVGIPDKFKPKPIPELQRKYIKACQTYIENIPRSKYLVDIIYQQAITYYAFNHFDKAVPVFEMIVKKYPRHRLAEFSADLIMDSLNMTKDWEQINQKAREFLRNSALLSGRNRLRKDLEKFKEMSSFYAAEIPAQKGHHLEAAERYMAFVTEFPKSKFNDVALFNAIVYFQKGGDLYKSIHVQEQFLRGTENLYKKSKLRPRVMYGLAKNYEAIAFYDKAADLYIEYVTAFPKDKHAGDAVYNAAVLYENIGSTEKAIDNYKLYISKYEKDEKNKQKIALQFGYIWMRKGSAFYDKAVKGFFKYFDDFTDISGFKDYFFIDKRGRRVKPHEDLTVAVKKGDANTIFAVYDALIKIYDKNGDKANYYKMVDRVLQLSRANRFPEKVSFAEVSRDVVAKAMLIELQTDLDNYLSIKFNNIPFKKKLKGYEVLQWGFDVKDGKIISLGEASVDELAPSEKANLRIAAKEKDRFNKISQERMKKKIELTVSLQKEYELIVAQTKSPRYTPAVLYYIGVIYKDLTDQMFKAPIAPWLSESQIAAYKQFLDEKAFGAQKNAVAYFTAAMKKGYETSVYNEYVKKAKTMLKYFPDVTGGKYYDENEIIPQPLAIETSSSIGKVDIDFVFPKISAEERARLKKKLNKPKTVPVASPQQTTGVKPATTSSNPSGVKK